MKRFKVIFVLIVFCYWQVSRGEEPAHAQVKAATAVPVSVKPRLGDRYYMKSVLSHVFGPSAKLTLRENIFYNGAVFGGPCDEYEQIRTGGDSAKELVDPDSFCPSDKVGSRFTQIPEENVIRIGYLLKTCEELVTNSESLRFAVNKVGAIEKSPTPKDYFKIFRLFSPTASITSNEETVFSKIENNSDYLKLTNEQRWRLLFKVTCSSLDWQIL